MVLCRMLLDFRNRPRDMIVDEELSIIGEHFSKWLDERYGDENVDLVFVTHAGMYDEKNDPHPPGWGLSEEEMWEALPGRTREEKRENIERMMRGEMPEFKWPEEGDG
jgi:hypothetical protein